MLLSQIVEQDCGARVCGSQSLEPESLLGSRSVEPESVLGSQSVEPDRGARVSSREPDSALWSLIIYW